MSYHNSIIRSSISELPQGTGHPLCFVGLGSNLVHGGRSPEATLQMAFAELAALSDYPVAVSSLWKTAALDCPPDSPPFVNAVLALLPRATRPEEMLMALQKIELQFGRVRSALQNEPRVLDLDLLLFGSELRQTTTLELPHPRLHLRRFVLEPLAEVAPRLVPPGQTLDVEDLLEVAECQGNLQRINIVAAL
jgi:2-amino-4-hydroxy-6-hydroxymethyldihydropteridine diphosphokinase